eukprot:12957-Chlamydomonas_euryale.AAC.1
MSDKTSTVFPRPISCRAMGWQTQSKGKLRTPGAGCGFNTNYPNVQLQEAKHGGWARGWEGR